MKKKIVFLSAVLLIVFSFFLYFYSFTTTEAEHLLLPVDYENDSGWQITGLENGKEIPLTSAQAVDYDGTVVLRRTVPQQWTKYNSINVDTIRAVLLFVEDELVLANHQTSLTEVGEMPLLDMPQNMPYSVSCVFNPQWVGKTITMVTHSYKDLPNITINFDLISNLANKMRNEATTSKNAIPGAMFGIISLLLFGLFLFQISTDKKGYAILLLAFSTLLQSLSYMSVLYLNPLPSMDSALFTGVYFLFPLLYLATKMTASRKKYLISVISIWSVYFICYLITFVFHLPVPIWFDKAETICLLLLAATVYFCIKERKTNLFIKHFLTLILIFSAGYALLFAFAAIFNKYLFMSMYIILNEAFNLYFRPILFWIFNNIVIVLFILSAWDLLQDRIGAAKRLERMQNDQLLLNVQMSAANEQLTALRNSQNQTVIYRHDMRHHLSLLLNYANEGDIKKIQNYLQQATQDIDALTPVRYCENETVNLILSAFDAKAGKNGIKLIAQVDLPKKLNTNETELCSILSNALENAINAVSKLQAKELKKIYFSAAVKNESLVISTKNAYEGTLEIKDNLPKTQDSEAGHGYGLKSMISIARRHGGVYSIDTDNNEFVLRIILPLKA